MHAKEDVNVTGISPPHTLAPVTLWPSCEPFGNNSLKMTVGKAHMP